MNDEIKVHVSKNGSDRNLRLRWTDPITGKRESVSAETSDRRQAQKKAGKLEAELQSGRYAKRNKMTWQALADRFMSEHVSTKRPRTIESYVTALNAFQTHTGIELAKQFTTERVAAYKATRAGQGASPSTINNHLRHLRKLAKWAHQRELLAAMPIVEMLRIDEPAGGRKLSGEEVDRLLDHAARLKGPAAPDMVFFIRGMLYSGLRLTEALSFQWEPSPFRVYVDDLTADYPRLVIPASIDKSRRNRRLPMTDELIELLRSVPESQRSGWVFRLRCSDGEPRQRKRDAVARAFRPLAERTRIVTKWSESGGNKLVSVHDLRRTFGFRLADVLPLDQLQDIMRHVSIETTRKYYVGDRYDQIAEALRGKTAMSAGQTSGQTAFVADDSF